MADGYQETIEGDIGAAARTVASLADAADSIAAIARLLAEALKAGNTVIFAGNGGSAADAQHLAAELAGRFLLERRPLAVTALTTNTSVLTAVGNDYGFEEVFARQIEGLARSGDAVVLISTSGTSPNILRAFEAARAGGCRVAVLTGARGSRLAGQADASLVVDADSPPRIQEAHIVAGHVICGLVEAELAGG